MSRTGTDRNGYQAGICFRVKINNREPFDNYELIFVSRNAIERKTKISCKLRMSNTKA